MQTPPWPLTRDAAIDAAIRSIHLMIDGTLADFAAVIHPDAVNRESIAEPPACRGRGPVAFHASALWLRSAWSGMSFEIADVAVQDELVVTSGTMTGRHTGDFVVWNADARVERVFVPTGRAFTVRHAHFQRLRDGLVVEHWAVRDDLGQATQLGWMPPSPGFLWRCARATRRARRD